MDDNPIWPLTIFLPVVGVVSVICCWNIRRWRRHREEHSILLQRLEYLETKPILTPTTVTQVPVYVPVAPSTQGTYYPQPATYPPYQRPTPYQQTQPQPSAPPGPRMI